MTIIDARFEQDQERAARARVFLDDVDVTSRCYYVDTDRGVVGLYRLDADGRKYIDRTTGVVAAEERHGRVILLMIGD